MLACEDLATKAELQELKDKLNQILGLGAGGSGQVDVIGTGSLEGTKIEESLGFADNAIQDIAANTPVAALTATGLASGSSAFVVSKGKNVIYTNEAISRLGQMSGRNAIGRKVAATGQKAAGGFLLQVASLAASVFNAFLINKTLDLIKLNSANVETFQNQYNSEYTNTLNLISKNRNNLDAVVAQIDEQKIQIQNQQNANSAFFQQLADLNTDVDAMRSEKEALEADYANLSAELDAYENELGAFQDEVAEVTFTLFEQVSSLRSQLDKANEVIQKQNSIIEKLQTDLFEMDLRLRDAESRLDNLELTNTAFRVDILQLKQELEQQKLLSESALNELGTRLALLENNESIGVSGGGGAAGAAGAVTAQNAILTSLATQTGDEVLIDPIIASDLLNNPSKFQDEFTRLNELIRGSVELDDSKLDELRTNLNTDIQLLLETVVVESLGDLITQTVTNTEFDNLKNAANTAICESTAPNGCIEKDVTKPIQDILENLIDASSEDCCEANNNILRQMQPVLNTVDAGVKRIEPIVTTTRDVVTHSTYGIESAFNLADKAWKATDADKIMNALTNAVVIHNGVMLSRDVAATVDEAAGVTLEAMGIKNSEGESYDVNSVLKPKLQQVLGRVLGTNTIESLTAKIRSYSRLYNTTAYLSNTLIAIADSSRNIAEIVASNTGQIGNALLDSGTVSEDSYQRMSEKVNIKNRALSELDAFRNGQGTIESGASTVEDVSSEALEIRENFNELTNIKNEWETAMEEAITIAEEEKEVEKSLSVVTATIESYDFVKGEES